MTLPKQAQEIVVKSKKHGDLTFLVSPEDYAVLNFDPGCYKMITPNLKQAGDE